jgi:hypothetical protein
MKVNFFGFGAIRNSWHTRPMGAYLGLNAQLESLLHCSYRRMTLRAARKPARYAPPWNKASKSDKSICQLCCNRWIS